MINEQQKNQTNEERRHAIEALPPLRDVIATNNLNAQKSLGQNFLLDMNITDKIVRDGMLQDGGSWAGAHIFEIGPGPGGLTRALLKSDAQHVTAIEFDHRAVQALAPLVQASNGAFSLLEGDALKTDIAALGTAPRIIVANLPYNIATPLLIGWLKDIRLNPRTYDAMNLMFQKEVAQRILASPGNKTYGRLTVITQWLCNVHLLYELPPSAFTPPPKVKSAIVHFKPKTLKAESPSFKAVEQVTAQAFNQRRKMIRSSLKAYLPAIESLGIDPTKRAEELSVENFLDLAAFPKE